MTRRFLRGVGRRGACACAAVVCLTALMAPACDQMPLTAPTGTTITLYASSTAVGLNGSVDITANVIESAGTPVQNGTVVTFVTTLGTIDPAEARTTSGKVTVRLLAGTVSGTAEVQAFSGGSTSAASVKITVGAAAAGRVDLQANPTTVPATGLVQLTAVVTDTGGNRLSGLQVSFKTDAGALAQTLVTTDGNGEARTSLSTTVKTTVTASVVGADSTVSGSLTIPLAGGSTATISLAFATAQRELVVQ